MFETAELGRKIEKHDYERLVPKLRMDLLRVQNELFQKKPFPVIVLIMGVDGAGKGETVNILHEWMDPRYLEATAFGPLSDEERERPDFWRFWRALPPKGKIGILFGSWYTRPIVQRAYGEIKKVALEDALARINTFEKELAADGALILKFWFHLGKKVQKKRLKSLEKDPKQRWRVTPQDWKHFKLYDTFYKVSTRALRSTSTGEAPWTIVEGADPRYRYLTVGQHILDQLTRRLKEHAKGATRPAPAEKPAPAPERQRQPTILNTLDLARSVEKKKYEKELEELQGRLNALARKASQKAVSTVLVFEGWDAGGKGGAIRRITSALDARAYRVIPIAAPTDEEKSHHYLWRFWRHIPRAGRITIYDRSWYGRVMVERVEGFAAEHEWMRAYKEINNFEEQLTGHGTVVVKFWLHISKDEQLRRFKEREKTSYKQYKITQEDYRNRAKWDDYELAVNDMVERTSTEYAPWHLIEANDKYYARLKILGVICRALEGALKKA
ncbi:MAG: polyphosphate:AMP phosphotransferase [Planctomycetota bacterium]|nr:polyphosphate:AMP phosphotransferase [Planctomycetota bacterium]